MELLERLLFFAVGLGVGFVLGFIVARLREIKEELDEVDDILKHQLPVRDQSGAFRVPSWSDLGMFFVLALVVYAAFSSAVASSKVASNQESIEAVTVCNQEFLSKVLVAVNGRTEYTADQARANVALQKAQSEFLATIVVDPSKTEPEQAKALREYFVTLTDFIEVNGNTARKVQQYPYPTIEEYNACLEDERNQDE